MPIVPVMARLNARQRARKARKATCAPFVPFVAPFAAMLDQAPSGEKWLKATRLAHAEHLAAQAAKAFHAPDRKAKVQGKGMAHATPIRHARPLSETRGTSSVHVLSMTVCGKGGCGHSVPRKGSNPKRFHEPMAGVLKARFIPPVKHTKARFSQPALAPVTPSQFANNEAYHVRRLLELDQGVAKRQAFRDAQAAEKAQLEQIEAARVVSQTTLVATLSVANGLASFAMALSLAATQGHATTTRDNGRDLVPSNSGSPAIA